MDIPSLSSAIHHYYQQGLALSTHKSYQAAIEQYLTFCDQIKHTPMPTSEFTLLLYIAHMGQKGLSHSTIRVYLSAIRSLHVAKGQHNHFTAQYTPRLRQVLHGIQKEQAFILEPRTRLPITIQLMRQIKTLISAKPYTYHHTMIWAACCTAFFGFMRCGEFTSPSHSAYDPTVHLSFSDVAVDSRTCPTFIRLTIKQSKTDRFRQGRFIYLGKTNCEVCPVEAILQYLSVRGATPGPLFLSDDRKPLTRVAFCSEVSSLLEELGLTALHYNTHSFRIGAATSAKDAGISDVYVKKLGRWQSDAFQTYIKPPASKLASLSKQLACN